MLKIEKYRIDEKQILGYYPNFVAYSSPAIIIEMTHDKEYVILCSTKNEVDLYIDELDSYFNVDKIEIKEEKFIN